MSRAEWFGIVIGGWVIVVIVLSILYREYRDRREDPPCLWCGEYAGHMPGCPID